MRQFMARMAVAALLGSVACEAHAQADPIENYLASAEQKAATVVAEAGSQGRGVAMEAGQAALNAIASFRAAYGDSLRQTEEALSDQQAQLFRSIKSAIGQLDEYTRGAVADLQGVADTLSMAISNIPFGKEIPRVTRVAPIFVAEGAAANRELIVRGIGLSNGDPELEVDGRRVRPNTETDAELRFELPTRAVAGNAPEIVATTLRLYEKKTKFFFFSSYVPRTYPVRLAVYPSEVGRFTLTPRRRVTVAERREVTTPEYRCDSPQGQGSHTVAANVVAAPGWTIDPNSIRYERTYSNHGAFTMNTTSPAGFTATLSCSGWGRIVGPFGVVIDAGSIGVEKGYFRYTESREVTALQDSEAKSGVLTWGDAQTVADLPADTETIVFQMAAFNGQQVAFDGAGTSPYVTVEFNAAAKIATVSAKGIEEALRR